MDTARREWGQRQTRVGDTARREWEYSQTGAGLTRGTRGGGLVGFLLGLVVGVKGWRVVRASGIQLMC